MATSIYVGNLPWSATEQSVQDIFATHGNVHSVKLVTDRETGRARGFGFVEMDDADAGQAITALNGTDVGGRTIRVNKAEDKPASSRRW